MNPERSVQQAQTLEQYFRVLKMLFFQEARTIVDPEVVRDVITVSMIDHTATSADWMTTVYRIPCEREE